MEGKIDASNVQVICPACKKATRISNKVIDGKKVRVCKVCGASLDKAVTIKKANKKADTKVVEATKTTKKVEKSAPKKKSTKENRFCNTKIKNHNNKNSSKKNCG